jgi:AmiR/NasT family two-component response regulator
MMSNNKDSGKLPVMLVVDDDMTQRLLMSETLLENDLAVEEAGDDVETLEVFRRISPGLVLMALSNTTFDHNSSSKHKYQKGASGKVKQ